MLSRDEIIEGNKLIAKFIGYDGVDCHNCKYSRDCNWIQCGLTKQEKEEQLKYHSSWDWLMPVVEKIESLDIRNNGYDFPKVKFNGDSCEIFAYAEYKGTTFYWKKWVSLNGKHYNHTNQCETKIEAAWKAVVEFIKWYNKNKN